MRVCVGGACARVWRKGSVRKNRRQTEELLPPAPVASSMQREATSFLSLEPRMCQEQLAWLWASLPAREHVHAEAREAFLLRPDIAHSGSCALLQLSEVHASIRTHWRSASAFRKAH